MNRKLQIFVSSTYTDMQEERQAAVEAILRAGHIPAGMELFAAGDESQMDTIRRWIDDSDVFMIILGGRYGTIEPKSGKGYIELEYEYAKEQRKPLFAAVIDDEYLDGKVKANGLDATERMHGQQLADFRDRVKSKICRFFKNTNDLKLIVFESLARFAENEDLPGWVRGTEAVDPKGILTELNRLQEENAVLADELYLLRSSADVQQQSLTDDAKKLLLAAAAANGYIMYLRSFSGASFQAGDEVISKAVKNPREEARWKAAIEELERHDLVEPRGTKGQTYRVTKRGYEIADEFLKSSTV